MIGMAEKEGLIRLADAEEHKPPKGIRVKDGNIICSMCEAPATTLHLVSHDGGSSHHLKAACDKVKHDAGGYWMNIEELANDLQTWLPHLSEKRGNMLQALIQGLGPEGLEALLDMRQQGL